MSYPSSPRVAIIGAGVSGLTTGVACASMGCEVNIYSDKFPASDQKNSLPNSSSTFSKGAVIPKNIHQAEALMRFSESVAIYRKLHSMDWPIQHQQHVEIRKQSRALPEYLKVMDHLEIPKTIPSDWLLKSENGTPGGWSYSYYLIDPPEYLSLMQTKFTELGGNLERKYVDLHELNDLDYDFIINCAGHNGFKLEQDLNPPQMVGEYQIEVFTGNKEALPYSCSYYLQHSDINIEEIFAFPQPGRLLIGGGYTKLNNSKFPVPDHESKSDAGVQINGTHLPEYLFSEITKMVKQGWGIDLTNYPLDARIGYYSTSVNITEVHWDNNHTSLLHNYAMGDMGFGLSWGNAMQCVRMIQNRSSLCNPEKITSEQILNTLTRVSVV